jgi:hypothetical protein
MAGAAAEKKMNDYDWARLAESIKPRNNNENFHTRQERVASKHSLTIPARTRVWVGALVNSNPDEYHFGCHGTYYTIIIDRGKTRIGTGSVSTIYAGNFVFQTATEHLTLPYVCEQQALITPPPGPADERLMEIYPKRPKQLDWPQEPFSESGPTGVILVRLAGGIWVRKFSRSRTRSHNYARFAACHLPPQGYFLGSKVKA